MQGGYPGPYWGLVEVEERLRVACRGWSIHTRKRYMTKSNCLAGFVPGPAGSSHSVKYPKPSAQAWKNGSRVSRCTRLPGVPRARVCPRLGQTWLLFLRRAHRVPIRSSVRDGTTWITIERMFEKISICLACTGDRCKDPKFITRCYMLLSFLWASFL